MNAPRRWTLKARSVHLRPSFYSCRAGASRTLTKPSWDSAPVQYCTGRQMYQIRRPGGWPINPAISRNPQTPALAEWH